MSSFWFSSRHSTVLYFTVFYEFSISGLLPPHGLTVSMFPVAGHSARFVTKCAFKRQRWTGTEFQTVIKHHKLWKWYWSDNIMRWYLTEINVHAQTSWIIVGKDTVAGSCTWYIYEKINLFRTYFTVPKNANSRLYAVPTVYRTVYMFCAVLRCISIISTLYWWSPGTVASKTNDWPRGKEVVSSWSQRKNFIVEGQTCCLALTKSASSS